MYLSGSKFRCFLVFLAALAAGCGKKENKSEDSQDQSPAKIILQTEWYAEPEQGGFYHALIHGYYKEVGLDVEIRQGGPNSLAPEKVATGKADFALARSDEAIVYASRNLPVLVVMATMQRDAQALLLHEENPVETFSDLNGKTIMATPGASWIKILKNRYGIQFDTIPTDYGMGRYLTDKSFIQMCYVTNEPYYARLRGANPKTLLLADSGYNPYRGVLTNQKFAKEHPELVRAFVAASIRGWRDYMSGNRSRTNAHIASLNPQMTEEFMKFILDTMENYKLVEGRKGQGERLGLITETRMKEQMDDLMTAGIIDNSIPLESFFSTNFLPLDLQDAAKEANAQKIQLTNARQSPDDLCVIGPIGGFEPYESLYIAYEDLLNLPTETAVTDIVWLGEEREVTVLDLDVLRNALSLMETTDFVVADCLDGYQSNFDAKVLKENKPFLVLKINGSPLKSWGFQADESKFSHYLNLRTEAGILNPEHKKPFGVNRLEFTLKDSKLEEIYEGAFANLSPEAALGREIYVGSCSSCHRPLSGSFGGTMSNRNLEVIAIHAKYNQQYFLNWVRDPQSQLKGVKMGPHPYPVEQMNQLISFLGNVP